MPRRLSTDTQPALAIALVQIASGIEGLNCKHVVGVELNGGTITFVLQTRKTGSGSVWTNCAYENVHAGQGAALIAAGTAISTDGATAAVYAPSMDLAANISVLTGSPRLWVDCVLIP